jgi:5-methylcytosine-specific restriction endonuclease McrA
MSQRLQIDEYHALCKAVLQRDGYQCRACGYRQTLSCHHLQYRSRGGADTSQNLCVLCAECHAAIHRSDLEVIMEENGADGKVWFTKHNNWWPS